MSPTPPPPPGHGVTDNLCVCGVTVPDGEAHAHYYHVSSSMFTVCPVDGAPVVTDLSVPGKEWRCSDCGAFYEFFGEAPRVPSTHELAVRLVAALGEVSP